MAAYLISGPSGSGKSTLGKELIDRGYHVIETDFEPGLSAWVDKETSINVVEMPPQPYTQEWLDQHAWIWKSETMHILLDQTQDQDVFFCGGAYNAKQYYGSFVLRFGLYTDDQTTIKRLQSREPERWRDDSPELKKMLDWNSRFKEVSIAEGAILLDGSRPINEVADELLDYVRKP